MAQLFLFLERRLSSYLGAKNAAIAGTVVGSHVKESSVVTVGDVESYISPDPTYQ
jgi:hypothetical protein